MVLIKRRFSTKGDGMLLLFMRKEGSYDLLQFIFQGYYAYGASAGREWYMNPAMQFKDDTINEEDLALLNSVFERVRCFSFFFSFFSNSSHFWACTRRYKNVTFHKSPPLP